MLHALIHQSVSLVSQLRLQSRIQMDSVHVLQLTTGQVQCVKFATTDVRLVWAHQLHAEAVLIIHSECMAHRNVHAYQITTMLALLLA